MSPSLFSAYSSLKSLILFMFVKQGKTSPKKQRKEALIWVLSNLLAIVVAPRCCIFHSSSHRLQVSLLVPSFCLWFRVLIMLNLHPTLRICDCASFYIFSSMISYTSCADLSSMHNMLVRVQDILLADVLLSFSYISMILGFEFLTYNDSLNSFWQKLLKIFELSSWKGGFYQNVELTK